MPSLYTFVRARAWRLKLNRALTLFISNLLLNLNVESISSPLPLLRSLFCIRFFLTLLPANAASLASQVQQSGISFS